MKLIKNDKRGRRLKDKPVAEGGHFVTSSSSGVKGASYTLSICPPYNTGMREHTVYLSEDEMLRVVRGWLAHHTDMLHRREA